MTLKERTLEVRVAQLEKELKAEKVVKTEAANAMIDAAEEGLGIDLRNSWCQAVGMLRILHPKSIMVICRIDSLMSLLKST